MKKKFILSLALVCLFLNVHAQFFIPPHHLIKDAPEWAQKMYADNPNVVEVTKAYREYHQEYPFVKNIHTKNYKFWKRKHQYRFKSDGTIAPYSDASFQKRLQTKSQELTKTAGNWSLVGPIQTLNPDEELGSDQACVYSLDQSISNPNVVFCGTEPGEVYKSTDGGPGSEAVYA